MNRRTSLKKIGTATFVAPFIQCTPTLLANNKKPFKKKDIHIFSKHLQWLDYENMAKTAKSIGFDGVDLTVRPKGHVLPENVETDLPKAVAAIRKAGLKADMMTTAILDPKDPLTEKILKTASSLGIKYYRLGWYKYKEDQSISKQLDAFKIQLQEIAQMNQHYQIHGGYQNHSNSISVGAPVWDIWYLIKNLDPQWLGCQYDIRHATVEGLKSWELGLKLLQSHIRTIVLKDFTYIQKDKGWTIENTPVGDNGAVDFEKYFGLLEKLNIDAPISLHAEYDLGGANKGKSKITWPSEKIIEALKQDLVRLRSYMEI